jgi:MFS transporter, ACS family, allantoate permease
VNLSDIIFLWLQNTVNAMTLVALALGNIIGTEIFQPKDAPAYIPGKIAILVLMSVQLFICYLLRWINYRMNTRKQAILAEEKARRGWTDEDVQKERERNAFLDLTDKQYVAVFFLQDCLCSYRLCYRNMFFVYTM